MKLLHLSDLHFSSDSYSVEPYKIEKGLIDLINSKQKDEEDIYLLVSGDITSSGKSTGFTEAKSFFDAIIKKTNIKKENFLVCPGNHDITDSSFEEFDKFSYGIRQDDKFTFKEKNSNIFIDNEIFFYP